MDTRLLIKNLIIIISFCLIPWQTLQAAVVTNFDPSQNIPNGADKNMINSQTANLQNLALGATPPAIVAMSIINAALSLLGGLCLVLLIYAGFIWIWARGNQEEVKKAKDIIQGTVIGIIIVLVSLGITSYVFTLIAKISGAAVAS